MPDLLNTVQGFVNGTIGSLGQQNGQVSPYFRPTRLAHNIFDQNESTLTNNTPYMGFQYFVRIFPNSATNDYLSTYFSDKRIADISPIIKSVTLPSMNIDTDVLNEYNRHRINQTKVNFEPVKLSFHDAVDGKVLNLWRAYYNYYFSDGINTSLSIDTEPNPPTNDFQSESFGYNLANVANEKYLFSKIEIYQVHGTKVNRVILYNPRISSFDHDSMSYDSSDLVEINMTFEYEFAEYTNRTELTDAATDGELKTFLSRGLSDPLEMAAFKNFENDILKKTSVAASAATATGPGASIANAQTPLGLIKAVKKEAQGVVGYAASASALFNQVQIDVLGVDTPIIEAPSVREFSAIVNRVPTSYSDVRRTVRNITKGS